MVKSLYESGEFADTGGFVARAYKTILNRDVDPGGWRWQAGSMRRGIITQWSLLGNLIYSQEFYNNYPAARTDNAEYVRLLYRNALGREATEAEVTYHSVTTWTTREDKALAFMNAAEFESRYGNKMYATLLYVILLRRSPEAGAADWWAGVISSGVTRESVAESILASGEYSARFP